ncbi:MAG: phosphopantetheine-binding protein [bacterium]|jgi:acyl carrier protein|nr:phosphopantetheine-binding protein [bacterium]
MEKEAIRNELKDIIDPYVMEKELLGNLSDTMELINDLKINSANIVDIVLDIEEKYDIMIDDNSINQMNTVGEAIGVIEAKIAEK